MFGYKFLHLFVWTTVRNRFVKLHGVREIIDGFFANKQYSFNLSHYISREFQTTLIAAVLEAQNPQLCKEVCDSYLFCGEPLWFYIPESAVTPQILSALSYCIAHSGKKWMIHSKGLDPDEADNLLKYLTCSKTPSCNCHKCTFFCSNTDSSICVFDLNSSQSKVDGIVKLVQTQRNLQWLTLSYCELVDDTIVVQLAEVLVNNTCLKMLHLLGCKITGKSIKAIADMLTKNTTLEWIGLKNNMSTLKEKDIVNLLHTIRHRNNTIYMIFLDNVFHTSKKVKHELEIINDRRQQRGVECLAILDCFKYNEACQRFISALPFIDQKVSNSI